MTILFSIRNLFGFAALACAAGLAGCAGARVPAIDPTGQNIFSGGSTSLVRHCHDASAPVRATCGPTPRPSLVAAPPPVVFNPQPVQLASCEPPQPSCAPPVAVVPVVQAPVVPVIPVPTCPPPAPVATCPTPIAPTGAPAQFCSTSGQQQSPQLVVTPSRIVAPVGSEVVLAAGLYGADGYLVMRQPLEWMLAQDGVGQIVCVGKESPAGVSHLLRHSPDKLTPNYALAHTSTISQTITRGTPNPADDIVLQRGQSYISVSSPTEGTSYVTVVAPKECDWGRRKQTATIVWVDAAWTLPPGAQVRAGQKHLLTTKLVRADGAPVTGWLVRYEVLEGPDAGFGVRGERAIEVNTDAAGVAAIDLLPRTAAAGITTVRTQIIRPATSRGDMPLMVVGQGTSAVNWSAPGLTLRALGPSIVQADGAVSYRVEVVNTGDQPSRNVVMSFTPPPGVTVLNSSPVAQPFGQRYEWQMPELQPRQSDVIELNCRASRAADLRATFKVRSGEGLQAEESVATRVFQSALSVKMLGPDAIEVGKPAKFRIEVTNTGATPLSNVTISDVFDPGLKHAQGESSPIVKAIGDLGPGETKPLGVTFIATQAGRQRHRLSATADGGHTAGTSAAITGMQTTTPPVSLRLQAAGPDQLRTGQEGKYKVEVTNHGTMAATNVRIVAEFGQALEPTVATGGDRRESGATFLAWTVPRMQAGETVVRQLNCRALDNREQAAVRFTVTGDPSIREATEVATRVQPTAGRTNVATPVATGRTLQPASPTTRPSAPSTAGRPTFPSLLGPTGDDGGSLRVSISPASSSLGNGGSTTYVVTVHNEQQMSDKDIVLTMQLPAGLKFKQLLGPTDVRSVSSDGRTIEVAPISEVRPNERLGSYRVEATGVAAGQSVFRVEARSARTPLGVSAEVRTSGGGGP